MSIISRLQLILVRIGFAKESLLVAFFATALAALAAVVLQLKGVDVLAKSYGPAQKGASVWGDHARPLPWQTLYELESEGVQSLAGSSVASNPGPVNGEALFLQAYRQLQRGDYAQALGLAQNMVNNYPHFQLGNLLYAELMNRDSDVAAQLESWMQSSSVQQRLQQLNHEARLRISNPDKSVFEGKLPEPLRFWSPLLSRVILVDAHSARMYVLAADEQDSSSAVPRVIFDAYVSIGNNGIGKWKEGDARTPIGVYFIQKHLTEFMLPDLYGSGALTLDYPSPIDKLQKRTGSGIWLHGSPSLQYARPPTATDGCVVLANDDMTRLLQLGITKDTPVIITDKLKWVSAKDFSRSDSGMLLARDSQALQPRAPEGVFGARLSTLPEAALTPSEPGATVISVFEWTDQQQQVAVVTYQRGAAGTAKKRSHAYWVRQSDQWRELGRSDRS